MGASCARLIRSGQMLGGRGVRIGRNPDERRLLLRKRCGNDVGCCFGLHRLCDGDGEAAVAMMAAESLVVTIAGRAVVENQRDLRAAGRAGHIDVVRAMQRAREQIHDRNEHSHEPTPVAQAAGSIGSLDCGHNLTLGPRSGCGTMAAAAMSTRNIVTCGERDVAHAKRRKAPARG